MGFEKNIEDYSCDVKDAICYQIDYLKSLGGLDVVNTPGPTDFDIKSVKTEGFEYSYDTETLKKRTMYFNGVPFSKITADLIKKELRIHGYMKRKIK